MNEDIRELVKEEVIAQLKNIPDTEDRDFLYTLKSEINELLFKYLPNTLTIKQLDALASIIYDMIMTPNYYLDEKET